jgi:hypothetical protein
MIGKLFSDAVDPGARQEDMAELERGLEMDGSFGIRPRASNLELEVSSRPASTARGW